MSKPDPRLGGTWASWSLSILLHLGIIAIGVGVWQWSQRSRPAERLAIEGTVVSAAPEAAEPLLFPEPEAVLPPEPEPEPLPEPEPEPPGPTAEELAAQQAETERLAREEARLAEQRVAEQRKAQEEAARQKAEQERQRKEREEREKTERERLAREKAEREQREREAAERARREAELEAQLAAERQRQEVRGSAQASQYKALLTARIMRAWTKPASARPGMVCEVTVTQVPGGAVTGVRFGRCNGDDAVRQSIENAVFKASPLPPPPDPALFEREFGVRFIPEE